MSEAWSSPIVILITSDESPLSFGKITIYEASWIFSLISLGAFMGNFFFGFLINRFGRKMCFNLVVLPIIVRMNNLRFVNKCLTLKICILICFQISWLLVSNARNVYYLYASRLINGFFAGAVFVIVPPFTAEIADDELVLYSFYFDFLFLIE